MTRLLQRAVWDKLRRRKVVQWSVVYAAGAWTLLQGIDFLVNAFHWPELTRPVATLGLLIGLPVVITLAWYHGDRGAQRVSATELTIILLLLLLGGSLLWMFDRGSQPAPTVVGTEEFVTGPDAAMPDDSRPSIAVLPFESRSRLEDDAFFVDGIHDDILTQLSKVSALKVISRTSVEQFRDSRLPMKSIAGQLGVTNVLEGGVQRAGDRVRINVQLIDAGSDAHLWAESYDRELTAVNIFNIQSEVAAAIADALQARLTAKEKSRVDAIPTRNFAAWEAYQLGKQRMTQRSGDAMKEALAFFQASIAEDPAFALAYVGLADTHIIRDYYGYAPHEESMAAAMEAIDRALTLDPDLAAAYASRGLAFHERKDYPAAEVAFRKAIDLNPNYATAYQWYALLLGDLGRFEESLQAAQQAVALDPLAPLFHNAVALALAGLGRFAEARIRFLKAIELGPAMPIFNANIGNLEAWAWGRIDKAVPWVQKEIELDPDGVYSSVLLSGYYLHLGDDTRAMEWLDRARLNGADSVYVNNMAANIHLYRGEQAEAVAFAHKALALDAQAAGLFILRDADLLSGDWQAARTRYAQVFPELLAAELPDIDLRNYQAAIELALVLQKSGEIERAGRLLDRSEQFIRTIPRMGLYGYGIADAQIAALRGQNRQALAALRQAGMEGWRADWWYHLDHDPSFGLIRDAAEFKAVRTDIERDMAAQRARLDGHAGSNGFRKPRRVYPGSKWR